MRSLVFTWAPFVAAVTVGCSGGTFDLADPSADPGDASSASDALVDSGGAADVGGDARPDTPPDAPPDARPDAPPDGGGPLDAGPPDVGPVCPAPDTTATFDASSFTCDSLPEKYAPQVQEAKRCTCDADCRDLVGRDFCGCGTYVNPGQSAHAALKAMRKQWEKLGCHAVCPALPCPMPTGAKCVATVDGKRCVDA